VSGAVPTPIRDGIRRQWEGDIHALFIINQNNPDMVEGHILRIICRTKGYAIICSTKGVVFHVWRLIVLFCGN
jgi:hypothetical protein